MTVEIRRLHSLRLDRPRGGNVTRGSFGVMGMLRQLWGDAEAQGRKEWVYLFGFV
jgi:hypothetical protein